jgi:hypothetical protein
MKRDQLAELHMRPPFPARMNYFIILVYRKGRHMTRKTRVFRKGDFVENTGFFTSSLNSKV